MEEKERREAKKGKENVKEKIGDVGRLEVGVKLGGANSKIK